MPPSLRSADADSQRRPMGSARKRWARCPTSLAVAVVLLAVTATVAAAAGVSTEAAIPALVAAVVAFAVGELWRHHCVRRLGAVTGDVLGSVEEVTATTFLVAIALLW